MGVFELEGGREGGKKEKGKRKREGGREKRRKGGKKGEREGEKIALGQKRSPCFEDQQYQQMIRVVQKE